MTSQNVDICTCNRHRDAEHKYLLADVSGFGSAHFEAAQLEGSVACLHLPRSLRTSLTSETHLIES